MNEKPDSQHKPAPRKAQTIFRRAHESEYVVIGNDLARWRGLTHQARGVLIWLLSYPPDWEINQEDLVVDGNGPASVRAIIEELEDAGYVVREQARKEHGHYGARLFKVYESPVPNDMRSGAERRTRRAAKSPKKKAPLAKTPQPVPPHAVTPLAAEPFAVNRTLQIQSGPKTESSKDDSASTATPARAHEPEVSIPEQRPAVYGAWEHVGGPLTAHIADFLRDAVKDYGESFVLAAIKEAGDSSGAVNVKFVRAILERCKREGRFPGAPRPQVQASPAPKPSKPAPVEDPDNWVGKKSNLPRPGPVRSPIPEGWKPPKKEAS